MKRKIAWEKWKNPFKDNIQQEGMMYEEYSDDNYIIEEPQKIKSTPFGVINSIANQFADKSFDFWILHTNFNITPKIAEQIEAIDGIETIEVYTRYRLRIGIPNSGLFCSEKIKEKIENTLCGLSDEKIAETFVGVDKGVFDRVIDKCKKLNEKFENWSLWMLPNGNIEAIGSDEYDDLYKKKVEVFIFGHQMIGGRVITSSD